jgi:outer membrane protein assembly factor BamD (BamD/ComL family)
VCSSDLIDINIKEKKYSDALILMEDLINEYPGYLYNEELNYDYVMTFYKSVEKQLRDNELIIKVRGQLLKFLMSFPDSKYCSDIEKEVVKINDMLIYREIEVGYFYEVQRNFVSALKRYLIAYQYESSSIVSNSIYSAELLYRIYYCYYMIGLKSEGQKYLDFLNNRFKNTNWNSLARLLK